MNLSSPPKFNIHHRNTLSKELDRLISKLGSGVSVESEAYANVVLMLSNADINFESKRDARYAIYALTVENKLLSRIDKKFAEFLDIFCKHNRATVKKLLRLFYAKYSELEKNKQLLVLKEVLLLEIRKYADTSVQAEQFINETKDGLFQQILQKYQDKTLEQLAEHFKLYEGDDYYELLKTAKILEAYSKLPLNENNPALFAVGKTHKHSLAGTVNNRLIAEEVVSILIEKLMKSSANIGQAWEFHILELVGDPRASSNHNAWRKIGDREKQFFISHLSRGDLNDFLENISDKRGNGIYGQRKQFWKRYMARVVNTRLLICNRDMRYIELNKPSLFQKIQNFPEAYGVILSGDISYIMMDFGEIKVIEGTENTSIRFYKNIPSWFMRNKYDRQDSSDIYRIVHGGSKWQQDVEYKLSECGIRP